jgi:hypothetical protein
VLPGRKEDRITRLIYKNSNGIPNRLGRNEKLDKAKDLLDELGADVVAYNKHRQNLRHRENRNGRNQLFRGGEVDVRLVVVHNVHQAESIGRSQEGVTGLIMFGPLTEYLDIPASGKDIRTRMMDNNVTQRDQGANQNHLQVQPVLEQKA